MWEKKFIDAIRADIRSGNQSCQVNHQALVSALHLIQHHDSMCPELSLRHIIKGAMNMAIALQHSKYNLITPAGVGKEKYNEYMRNQDRWFVGYNEALLTPSDDRLHTVKIAIPVIKQAAQGPLYVTPCLSNTLKLYFEYMKNTVDITFTPPKIPIGRTFNSTFNTLKEEQFLCLSDSPDSLLNLSLFAVKKNQLDTSRLPSDLKLHFL